jgi:hypothetical protein
MRCWGGGPEYLKFGRKIAYERSALDAWRNERRARNTSDAERLPRRMAQEPCGEARPGLGCHRRLASDNRVSPPKSALNQAKNTVIDAAHQFRRAQSRRRPVLTGRRRAALTRDHDEGHHLWVEANLRDDGRGKGGKRRCLAKGQNAIIVNAQG